MGEVLLAHDNDIDRDVAVKRLKADLQHPEHSARFVDEVRTVGQLEHPNIVPIHDAGVDAEGYFFVMKRLEGESLEAIIARLDRGEKEAHARWPFERRVEVMRKVLDALRFAHRKGVVHRDLKPGNVFVGPMGEVFLLDWGIAKRIHEKDAPAPQTGTGSAAASGSAPRTQVGAILGTPMYMAPEQARGEPVDERSDLYSFCLTLHEFLTLRSPYAHLPNTAQVLTAVIEQKVPIASLVRHPHQRSVPMDLAWLLHKGLAKDPAERYQSADELLQRLDDRAEGKVPIQCHITATKRLSYELLKVVNQHPIAFAAVLVAALGAGVYRLLA